MYEIRAGAFEEAGALEAAKAVLPQVKKVRANSIKTEQAVVAMYFLKRFILLVKMCGQTHGKHMDKETPTVFPTMTRENTRRPGPTGDNKRIWERRILSLCGTDLAQPAEPERPGISSVIFICSPNYPFR
jgi:hypothetical protein